MPNHTDNSVVVRFDEERIAAWTEADLLKIVVTMYEMEHRVNGHLEDVRGSLGGKSIQAVTNYLAGLGSIGLQGWSQLYDLTHNEFIVPWCKIKMQFLFKGQDHV